MESSFPAAGNQYFVDFKAFTVILSFTSNSSLTYTVINSDGSTGQIETVNISVKCICADIFLVTWQEADKTTVVHIEDYGRNEIVTNITNPDNSFQQLYGTFKRLDEPLSNANHANTKPHTSPREIGSHLATNITYSNNIRPLFRDSDINCMARRGVMLADANWMCTPKNADDVYTKLSIGDMPPDSPWPQENLNTFKSWIESGLRP
jgi:hypothetical protein